MFNSFKSRHRARSADSVVNKDNRDFWEEQEFLNTRDSLISIYKRESEIQEKKKSIKKNCK